MSCVRVVVIRYLTLLWLKISLVGTRVILRCTLIACVSGVCLFCGRWTNSITRCSRSTRSYWVSVGSTASGCGTSACRRYGLFFGIVYGGICAGARRVRGRLKSVRRVWVSTWRSWISGWSRVNSSIRRFLRRFFLGFRRLRLILMLLKLRRIVVSDFFLFRVYSLF